MSLKGIKVVEIAGLAPVPFCGMILRDHGASVLRVDRVGSQSTDTLSRGKQSLALDFKKPQAVSIFRRLIEQADVVIEPFRPGVMEKLGLGPKELFAINKRLVYARISGFGQTGPWSRFAGHDINYTSISGMLDIVGRRDEKPMFATNLIADFAGGGMMCAMGILMAIIERQTSGIGQVVDTAMNEGAAYLGSFVYNARNELYAQPRGQNLIDSGAHFYETYETSDGLFMAVGAIEPQFYSNLLRVMNIENPPYDQHDATHWPEMKALFAKIFKTKTRREWTDLCLREECCVTPVLRLNEIASNEQNQSRGLVLQTKSDDFGIAAAPRLSRTPGASVETLKHLNLEQPTVGQHTIQILTELKYSKQEIDEFLKIQAIEASTTNAKL